MTENRCSLPSLRAAAAVAALVAIALTPWLAAGQTRRGGGAGAAAAVRIEPAKPACQFLLGLGVQTNRTFCDVMITRDPAEGVIVQLPPHTGELTISFDLHNRHTYSEELVKQKRAYRRYTAMIGLLAMDNTPLGRAVIDSEFRTAEDLFDRIAGGTGVGGVKAVAPTGVESVSIVIPADEPAEAVSIVGLRLTEVRVDGTPETFVASGRPVAVISNVTLQYRPAPPRPARRR